MRTRPLLMAALPALMLLAGGCDDHSLGPVGPLPIPFDLLIPPNRPAGDFYAVSGVTTTTAYIRVGDSILKSQVPAFYAQFNTDSGGVLPKIVLLNQNTLDHNLGSDTLRLLSVKTGNVLKENVWTVGDSTANQVSVTMPQFDIVDSVGPFQSQSSVNSGAPLTIGWRIPVSGSSGLTLVWSAPNHKLVLPLNDFIGRVTISAADISQLIGSGRVTLVRYTNQSVPYHGKTMVVTRIAQHSYNVTVQ